MLGCSCHTTSKLIVPLPLHNAKRAPEAWPPAGSNFLIDVFYAASHPRAAPRLQQRQASLPGLNKGGNEKILCKESNQRSQVSQHGDAASTEAPTSSFSRISLNV